MLSVDAYAGFGLVPVDGRCLCGRRSTMPLELSGRELGVFTALKAFLCIPGRLRYCRDHHRRPYFLDFSRPLYGCLMVSDDPLIPSEWDSSNVLAC